MARIEELTKALDQDNTAKVSVISLENLSSVEAVRILDKLKAQSFTQILLYHQTQKKLSTKQKKTKLILL